MKLSTKSRYGTRLLLDMAQHMGQGPIQLGVIAKRQNIPLKYLEQIIIPLKKAELVKSVRGQKGGHMLAKSPEEITVGEIVALMEGGIKLTNCVKDPGTCDRSETCLTRHVWQKAADAMYGSLNGIRLSDLVNLGRSECEEELF
jgi:Rrf2 family transcriptional regulator, iron-sulfur cluster assembly transcription factor